MGWDGNGNFTRTDGTRTGTQVWQDARDAGVKIVADGHDTHDQDLADGLENAVALDGQNTTTTDNAILRFDAGNNVFEGVTIAASEIVGRGASGDVRSLSAATARGVIDALGATADKASSAQATNGTDDTVYMTPAKSATFLSEQTGLAASAFSAIGAGAIVESGTNSNGSYVRWENGEQACFLTNLTLTETSTTIMEGAWTYPATFLSRPTPLLMPSASASHWTTSTNRFEAFNLLRITFDGSSCTFRFAFDNAVVNGGDTASQNDAFAWGFWK